MTAVMPLVLLVATLAAMGSSLALLVTLDAWAEEALVASWCWGIEDPERDPLDWEWRLRMAVVPEAYWY